MVKRDVPKRVTLPKGRTFLARYKRTTRAHLTANIHLARSYKERAAPKGKKDVHELLQLLLRNNDKELEIFFVLQRK